MDGLLGLLLTHKYKRIYVVVFVLFGTLLLNNYTFDVVNIFLLLKYSSFLDNYIGRFVILFFFITFGYNQWRFLKRSLSIVAERYIEDKTLHLLITSHWL